MFEYISSPQLRRLWRLVLQGSPRWDNNFCKADATETAEKARSARNVPIPEYDPIHGKDGPLVEIWKNAATAAA